MPVVRRFDVVVVLIVVLLVKPQSSTKSTVVCPVRPLAETQGHCRCSVLDEIQCRGLYAVPEIDVNASYGGRKTYRSLYLARQHIRRLPDSAFAALNVRRIVLDFNPIGDRIDPGAFRGSVGTVDLARLGLVSRRRRTSHHVTDRRSGLVRPKRRQYFNDSDAENADAESRQAKLAVAVRSRRYTKRLNIGFHFIK